MEDIKTRIQQTLDNLCEKKATLERHKKQYIDLKFKLFDYEQCSSNDHPEITVQMTSKARVKARVIDPSQILVFLGCEYFVERTPKGAVRQVENKLKYLTQAIDEFEGKIKEAKKTMGNIDAFVDLQKKEEEAKLTQDGNEGAMELNEESLPFMDIREELDEDGNVIKSTVEAQNKEKLKDFGESHGMNLNEEEEDELQELLRDMEITPRLQKKNSEPKIQEIKELVEPVEPVEPTNQQTGEDESHEDIQTVTDDLNDAVSSTIVERDVEPAVSETVVEKETEPSIKLEKQSSPATSPNDFFDLFKEMGIVNKSSITTPITQPTTSEKAFKSESIEHESSSASTKKPDPVDYEQIDPSQPAISQDDILQLQVIADDMEEDGYEYGFDEDDTDDEDYDDIQSEDNDDAEEDDDDDWDFTNGEDNLVPDSYRALFAKELERVRAQNAKVVQKDDDVVTDDDAILKKIEEELKPKKQKKSVSFAKELQIKEIENISEELKAAESIKVSKFKQMMSKKPSQRITEAENGNGATALNDIVEKEPPVSDIIESTPVVSDIVESTPVPDTIVESSTSSEETAPAKRVSRFKSSLGSTVTKKPASTSSPTSTSTAMPTPSTTQPKEETTTQQKPKRLSKFKVSRTTPSSDSPIPVPISKPTSIPAPVTTYTEPSPEEEYENIKAYALNEDEDDDALIDSITENMAVYNPEVDDDDDEDETFEDLDDEDDGPILLDNIVENDDVDEPSYFVDDNILTKEYQDLRKKMIQTYGEKQKEAEERIILKESEGQELEPIDEHGNPIKESRFKKRLTRKST